MVRLCNLWSSLLLKLFTEEAVTTFQKAPVPVPVVRHLVTQEGMGNVDGERATVRIWPLAV